MNESAFRQGAPGGAASGEVNTIPLVAGCSFLLLSLAVMLFASVSVISAPGPSLADASSAEYLDLHFGYFHERSARAPASIGSCN